MRTFVINQFIKGIFVIFFTLMLSGCTGREDIAFELDGRRGGTESLPEADGESVPEREGESGAGTEDGQETTLRSGAESDMESGGAREAVPSDIYVHICGAVEKPGVYILAAGSRVYEGVAAAGGFREDACEDFINQAGILQDGQRLVIPTEDEIEEAETDGSYQALWQEEAQQAGESGMAGHPSGGTGGLVNINTASETELSAIPGIGAGKASAIVQYRQENGSFASIEDIMKVSGIKEGTFEKIKDRITVN